MNSVISNHESMRSAFTSSLLERWRACAKPKVKFRAEFLHVCTRDRVKEGIHLCRPAFALPSCKGQVHTGISAQKDEDEEAKFQAYQLSCSYHAMSITGQGARQLCILRLALQCTSRGDGRSISELSLSALQQPLRFLTCLLSWFYLGTSITERKKRNLILKLETASFTFNDIAKGQIFELFNVNLKSPKENTHSASWSWSDL